MSWLYHPDLLASAVPRYTSYPTAVDFKDTVAAPQQAAALALVPANAALSLYLHIPFCDQICWYCGCNTGANTRPERLERYVSALRTEIATVAGLLEGRGHVVRIHFGGGSPNSLATEQLTSILHALEAHFPGATTAERAMEADPRGLNAAYCQTLGILGFDRVSLGAQTFAGHVQAAINRIQPYEQVAAAAAALRRAGVQHINLDLMYGLPLQTAEDLDATITQALTLSPDRVAMFGYAHLPASLARQRMIRTEDLPGAAERFAMSQQAHDRFTAAGYQAVGFDHFAVPGDSLERAARDGRLKRNFQGFTDDPAEVLIGFGSSAISLLPGLMVQNEKASGSYSLRASLGRLVGVRGVARSREDQLRWAVIEQLLCHGAADVGALCAAAGFPAHWLDAEIAAAAPLAERGLVTCSGRDLRIPDAARPYARIVAHLFDCRSAAQGARFSKAV